MLAPINPAKVTMLHWAPPVSAKTSAPHLTPWISQRHISKLLFFFFIPLLSAFLLVPQSWPSLRIIFNSVENHNIYPGETCTKLTFPAQIKATPWKQKTPIYDLNDLQSYKTTCPLPETNPCFNYSNVLLITSRAPPNSSFFQFPVWTPNLALPLPSSQLTQLVVNALALVLYLITAFKTLLKASYTSSSHAAATVAVHSWGTHIAWGACPKLDHKHKRSHGPGLTPTCPYIPCAKDPRAGFSAPGRVS